MAPEPQEVEEAGWPSNYFNYFTEVEERFQKARGTGLFLMSPLDWALVETWKNAGVPLEAALRGIDAAFEKWRTKKKRGQNVNSVAYCTQAVLAEAQAMAGVAPARGHKESAAPFSLEDLEAYLRDNAGQIRKQPGFDDIAAAVDRLAVRSRRALSRSGRSGTTPHRARRQNDRARTLAPNRRPACFAPAVNSISNFAPIAEK